MDLQNVTYSRFKIQNTFTLITMCVSYSSEALFIMFISIYRETLLLS